MVRKFVFHPGSGTNKYTEDSIKWIKLFMKGCANRPFFHVGIQEEYDNHMKDPIIEQLGTFDPVPNKYNEKLVALNYERIEFWLKKGAKVSTPVSALFGLAGYFPIHPYTMREAWRYRHVVNEEVKKQRQKAAEAAKKTEEAPS